MRSKNSKAISTAERAHMLKVKEADCAVCGKPGPSEAHHIKQGLHFCTIACCTDCHNNWHGTKELWRIRKVDEIEALNITLSRVKT
jgi:hypothetical protein